MEQDQRDDSERKRKRLKRIAELPAEIRDAHSHCTENRSELKASNHAGCFYCCRIYDASTVCEWLGGGETATAFCPKCGIDSVIGDASGVPIETEFLERMNHHWFQPKRR